MRKALGPHVSFFPLRITKRENEVCGVREMRDCTGFDDGRSVCIVAWPDLDDMAPPLPSPERDDRDVYGCSALVMGDRGAMII